MLTLSSTTSVRMQLLILIDQLYVNHASGDWRSKKKLKSVIRECCRLAHAVELYRHGSLTSEEIAYVYGVLCHVALHGCDDAEWSMKLGRTAMQHTMELRGKERHTKSHEKNDCSSTAVQRQARASSSSCPTPLSSALLFALVGSGLMFDAFIHTYDTCVKMYDEKLANKYRGWCLEVMRMQNHLAQTIPIAQSYALFSKVRSFRAVDQIKGRKPQISEARRIAQKYGMKVIECGIDFEETLLQWISEEEESAAKIGGDMSSQKYSSESDTKHALDSIITRYEHMGDKASAKRAKQVLKDMMEFSTQGGVGNVHHVQFGDRDTWK
jgi:hypothetical protein